MTTTTDDNAQAARIQQLEAVLRELVHGRHWYERVYGGYQCHYCDERGIGSGAFVHAETCPIRRGQALLGE